MAVVNYQNKSNDSKMLMSIRPTTFLSFQSRDLDKHRCHFQIILDPKSS